MARTNILNNQIGEMDIARVCFPQKRFIIGNKAIHVSLKARDKDWGL